MAGLDVHGLSQPKIEIVDGETLQSSRGDRGSIMPLRDDILSYREMCDSENIQTLQRGMNFRINPSYSVILMSQRANAPYHDRVYEDGITIEYEGHDAPKQSYDQNPKHEGYGAIPAQPGGGTIQGQARWVGRKFLWGEVGH